MTRKGKRLIFLYQDGEIRCSWRSRRLSPIGGNANERVDAVGRMGKSCLFFLSSLSLNETLESIHSKIGVVVNVKSHGSSVVPISVDGP